MIHKYKAFRRQRIPESKDILITTKSSDRKFTQTIQKMSEPPPKKGNGTSSASTDENLQKQY